MSNEELIVGDTPKPSRFWKYLGAMFMEKKNGTNAVSFTRVLALVTFAMVSVKWWLGDGSVPETMLYTFWGLVGGKTAESMMAIFRGKKGE